MSSVKWLFWLVVLLIGLVLAIHWPAAERQSAPDVGAGRVRPNTVASGEMPPTPPLPAAAREAIAPNVDFSPPPGNVASMVSPASPFVSPTRGNTGGTIGDWGRGAKDIAGAFWRAALATIGMTGATSVASSVTPTVAAQTAVPNTKPDFETPPGIGSPRGGK